jgi:hypothetical protein
MLFVMNGILTMAARVCKAHFEQFFPCFQNLRFVYSEEFRTLAVAFPAALYGNTASKCIFQTTARGKD